MSVSEFYTNLTILRLPDPRTRQIKNAIVYTYVRARRSVVMALVAAAGIRTRRFNFCKIEKKKKSHGFKKRALSAHRLDGKKTAIMSAHAGRPRRFYAAVRRKKGTHAIKKGRAAPIEN